MPTSRVNLEVSSWAMLTTGQGCRSKDAPVAHKQPVHFLWRPQLRAPKDELVLEAAVNAKAEFLVTHNLRDFEPSRRFALQLVTPGQFLNILDGENP